MTVRGYMSICPGCAEKTSEIRFIERPSREFMGSCSQCMKRTMLKQYAVGPTYREAEIMRRRRRAEEKKNRTVSGERGRAERRSSYGQTL